jgi:hypothetical protein
MDIAGTQNGIAGISGIAALASVIVALLNAIK